MRIPTIFAVFSITIICALLCAYHVRLAANQRAARDWLASHNGTWQYRYHLSSFNPCSVYHSGPPAKENLRFVNPDNNLTIPKWILAVTGRDMFDEITQVWIDGNELDNVEQLRDLPDLKRISIYLDSTRDIDFASLKKHRTLKKVFLEGPGATSETAEQIRLQAPNVSVSVVLPKAWRTMR